MSTTLEVTYVLRIVAVRCFGKVGHDEVRACPYVVHLGAGVPAKQVAPLEAAARERLLVAVLGER
jgi:hypothetical protein